MNPKSQKTAVIIGAGPAGLTAALELLRNTNIKPIVLEASGDNGGISKTVNHNGNRIDIGGHRFFSKSDRVMDWWLNILPVEESALSESGIDISYHNKTQTIYPKETQQGQRDDDDVMLVRSRTSRIFFGGKFYDYPISLSVKTLSNLGLVRTVKIGVSYLWAMAFPIRDEKTLEEFFINRFGRELYNTFFKDYTEKVWGVPCAKITAEWGAQRIKGLSITKAITHAFKSALQGITKNKKKNVAQKDTETSLIEFFLYPKFGPGQMWDCVARDVLAQGGEIHYHSRASLIHAGANQVSAVEYEDSHGKTTRLDCDYCFSTMPIRDLVKSFSPEITGEVRDVSDGLIYRDFLTVGLLVNKLKVHPDRGDPGEIIPDNWIYIQEPHVKLGRLQIFNNWSPEMVSDPEKIWIGLEYFCNEGDAFWSLSDEEIIAIGIEELASIHIIDEQDVVDSVLLKMPKAYPAYFGTYDQLPVVRERLDRLENLFLVGRNGMHKYNNQDHSMLSAMASVENIVNGRTDKNNIWEINTEEEYHESK
ncbi:MAG: NAD(P)/FAD-dependent oxidoreductase [Acidiferrobacterales bacterium]|nr:NAD(P)/FAD-dependent oxidoreductase [Acidiferrobacterales bacterium]